MPKITIGVYKSYRNSGYRNHRQKTKKHWCHYFIEYDEYEPEVNIPRLTRCFELNIPFFN